MERRLPPPRRLCVRSSACSVSADGGKKQTGHEEDLATREDRSKPRGASDRATTPSQTAGGGNGLPLPSVDCQSRYKATGRVQARSARHGMDAVKRHRVRRNGRMVHSPSGLHGQAKAQNHLGKQAHGTAGSAQGSIGRSRRRSTHCLSKRGQQATTEDRWAAAEARPPATLPPAAALMVRP